MRLDTVILYLVPCGTELSSALLSSVLGYNIVRLSVASVTDNQIISPIFF